MSQAEKVGAQAPGKVGGGAQPRRMVGPVVVIGAGPYGLSVAANLGARGVSHLVLGRPMEFWEGMPAGMFLKSPWSASSLDDGRGELTLDRYIEAVGARRASPIPLSMFLDYAAWFRARAVPEIDTTYARCLRQERSGFAVELADGRTVEAGRVVVAAGVGRFAHLPAFAAGLPQGLVTHSSASPPPEELAGASVVVVGTGQSGLEWAALLHEAGARVELMTRGEFRWVSRRLFNLGPLFRRMLYAPSDVGPAGVSRIVDRQGLVRRLPARARRSLTRRSLRPAGAAWLRPRVEGVIPMTAGVEVIWAEPRAERLEIRLSDGSSREVDHLILATGYRPDLGRLEFLETALRERIAAEDGLPKLDKWFQSSVPGLHFVGALAEHSYGPLPRFVAGGAVAARQVAAAAARA